MRLSSWVPRSTYEYLCYPLQAMLLDKPATQDNSVVSVKHQKREKKKTLVQPYSKKRNISTKA
jgi:hypothetical protein